MLLLLLFFFWEGMGWAELKNKQTPAYSRMIGQTLLGFGEAEATEPVSRSFSWTETQKKATMSSRGRWQGSGLVERARRWHGDDTNNRLVSSSCPPSVRVHMDSNSSMRCLVLPWRICRRVLYLSRPALTFSACSMSFCVFLVSSRASANSELRAWTGEISW